MTRFKTSSGQFGLIGGICRATSDCILVREPAAASTARWKGNLYILAEPVTEGSRSYGVAQETLHQIAEAYYQATSPSVTTCLNRALQEANRRLFERNMQASGYEKVTLGITCAVLRGRELYLAQVLPGQAYVVHRGNLEAFPLNPSWDPEAATLPTLTITRLHALGWAEEVSPEFFHSSLSPGDIFCLCSSNIGRSLGRQEAEQVLLYQEPGDIVEHLYRRVHGQGFQEGQTLVVEVEPAVRPATEPIYTLNGMRQRVAQAGEVLGNWGRSLAGEVQRLLRPRPRRPRPQVRPRPRPRPQAEETPEIPSLARPKPTGPWWKRLAEGVNSLLHPRQAYPRLKRPQLRIRPARRPREKGRRGTVLAIVLIGLLVIAALAYLIYQRNEQIRDAEAHQLIGQAHDLVTQAGQTTPIEEANRILDQAEDLLQQALATERVTPEATMELKRLQDERDRINQVLRLTDLTQLLRTADLTATVASSGFGGGCLEVCRLGDLIQVGKELYFLEKEKGTVYIYLPDTNQVVPLLWAGTTVEGRTAAPILAITRLDRPAVCGEEENLEPWLAAVDADRWLYLYRDNTWETHPLYNEGNWAERGIDLEGYMGNLYVLRGAPDQILKYYCDAYELKPEHWLQDLRVASVEAAADMVIDGHIYLLLETDGTVIDLLQGELEKRISYQVYPPLGMPVQVYTDLESPYLYVADHYEGRVLQLRKEAAEGEAFIRQLRGPTDQDLRQLRAIVVDEAQGVLYLTTESGLYRGRIPPWALEVAPSVSPTPTPGP